MTTHVAFLRAINTGKRRITNNDLVAAARSVGLADAVAYQASGNLLFGADESDERFDGWLSRGLGEAIGFDVQAIVRSASEIEALLSAQPFAPEHPPPNSKPQVIVLAEPVADLGLIDSFATDEDRLAPVGTDLLWWPRAGISTSRLDVAGLERAVGTMTVRTVGTIERIMRKLS